MSGDLPEGWPLSPGAERVVNAAKAAAGDGTSGDVTGIQILHALWQDESRAAEVLEVAGFDAANAGSRAAPQDLVRKGNVLQTVLRSARRLVGRSGEGEIGTEHLLAALLDVDANVRELLPEIDVAGLLVADTGDSLSNEPLDFDDELTSPDPSLQHPAKPTIHHSPLTTSADTHRILDAAANRGREGLRVVEDFVRFRLSDVHLSGLLKALRHDLTDALSRLGGSSWHRLRDTPGDVGTEVVTRQESVRTSLEDVLRANCKRVEESLRSLEEYGKLIDAGAAGAIEQLRYRFYTIEQAILTTEFSRERLETCRLYLLVSNSESPHGFERTVSEALAGGVDMIQLREKSADDQTFLQFARQVRDWTRDAGALFIVNDRPDIAVLSDADGVHVGQDDMPCHEARKIVGSERLVGVSTHAIEQARQAVLDGADYIGTGPVSPSQTKQFEEFAGLDYIREVAAEISLPSFAIGGIDETNITDVIAAGALRMAVSRAVCGATDMRAAAEALSIRLRTGGE